jgi:hypothetical protein
LMLWCYYAVAVLLLGAEYIEVRWHSPESGGQEPPSQGDSSPPADGDQNQSGKPIDDLSHHARTAAQLLTHPLPGLMH